MSWTIGTFHDADRGFFDRIGAKWSSVNLFCGGCYPATITGKEHLPPPGEAVLYVANHASWFDIPLLALTIKAQFKFIAASALGKLPLIGQQLVQGKHVLIDRRTRRGQLRSFKESVSYLKRGISIVAFPEGTRSKDGRLREFKGGVFSMATKARVPIVPSPPTRPIVLPVSSKCGQPPRWQRSMWARSPVAIALACGTSEHESDSTKVIAICAIASVEYVGMLQTVMPLARAAAVSTLL